MKRRLIQGLLFAALICGAVLLAHPTAAWANVTYLDATGTEQTCLTATPVTESDTAWGGSEQKEYWYVVSGNVTIGTETEPVRVRVSGDVHLILTDDSTLTVTGGIEVQDDDNVLETQRPNSLTIYGQSTDDSMGKLTAAGGKYQASIGGTGTYDGSVSNGGDGGIITINGGRVTVTGGLGSAGIGGSDFGGDGGTITINGGRVTATGGNGGAGIGGGSYGSGGTITINGGDVTAIGNDYSAGIGGSGAGGSGGTITIKNGNVTATSVGGAGIGGGNDGVGGSITIYDGSIEATSVDGAGIGGGNGGAGGSIIIHDGSIEATSVNGAGIGGGRFGGTSSGNITIHGGNIYAANENGGAGIGAGDAGICENISITGGIIMATNELNGYGIGGYYGSGTVSISDGMVTASGEVAGIGSDYEYGSLTFVTQTDGSAPGQAVIVASSIEDQSGKEAWSGVIFEGDTGQIYGTSVTPNADFTIPAGKTLTIAAGQTLTIDNGITAINHGTINNDGTITISVSGTFNNSGEMTGNNPEGTVEEVPKLEQSTFTYTGDDLFNSLKLTPNESGWSLETLKIVDAGVYTVYATKGTDRIPYTVTVKPIVLTVTGATVADKIFDERLWAEVKEIDFASESGEVSLTMPTDYGASAWFETPEAGVDKVVDVNLWLNNKNYKFETGSYATYQATATIYGIAANGTIQSGRSGAVTLPALPEGASYGTPTTADTAAVQDLSITDNVLYYSGSGISDGATYTVSVPVTNFNDDYTITVTLTGEGSSTGVTPPIDPPTVSEETIDAIADAEPGETVTVDLSSGSTTLDKDVFETLAGKDITLDIDLGDGLSWTVNGSDVPEDADFTDLDLGVTMNSDGIPVDVVEAITGEHGSVQVELAHNGAFGFTMTLTAPVGEENAGLWANLYHFDEEAGKMTFETAAQIGDDGSVSLAFSHASQYAIVIDDHNHGVVELPFTDVSDSDWFYEPVCYVYENGLMTGTSADTFEPNTHLSRAMLVAVLHRLEGGQSAESAGFSDVNDGDWYAQAVNWAASVGVVDGFDDGTFQPNTAITREQLAAILRNYAAYKGFDTSASGDLSTYTDAGSVSDWAKESVEWVVGSGLIGGYEDSTLRPQGTTTRAEVASVLERCLGKK